MTPKDLLKQAAEQFAAGQHPDAWTAVFRQHPDHTPQTEQLTTAALELLKGANQTGRSITVLSRKTQLAIFEAAQTGRKIRLKLCRS